MSTAQSPLAAKKCAPCAGTVTPLGGEEKKSLLTEIPGWTIVNDHHLNRKYRFKNFQTALEFVNKVGEVAEAEGHHPNISFTWGKAEIDIWTHKIDNLTENDFVLAAKISAIPR